MGASLGGGAGGGASGRRRGRSRLGGGSAGAPMAEINVTPFVDVVLVLLIIFMVSAQLIAPAPVQPEVFAEIEGLEELDAAPHVVVEANGDLVVAGALVSLEEAPALVAEAIEDPARDLVIVQALDGAGHDVVLGVVRALAEAGFRQVGLARDRDEAP